MRRRSRTRRVLKWTCTALCALVVGTWLLSAWYDVVVPYSRNLGEAAAVNTGVVHVWWENLTEAEQRRRTGPEATLQWELPANFPILHVRKLKDSPRLHWILPTYRGVGTQTHLWMPLWLLLILIGVPTTFLWWRDRLPAAGHCPNCGYDLTGNVSGRCPECGTPIEREGKRA